MALREKLVKKFSCDLLLSDLQRIYTLAEFSVGSVENKWTLMASLVVLRKKKYYKVSVERAAAAAAAPIKQH